MSGMTPLSFMPDLGVQFGAQSGAPACANTRGAARSRKGGANMRDLSREPEPLPYDPHRVFENEPHVLVFSDVRPSDWPSAPQPVTVGVEEWLAYVETSDERRDELHRMPYGEYLRTPEWAETRKIVKQRAGYRCQKCGRPDSEWNVHHLTYERRGYEDLSDLVLLCRKCHEATHGIAS